MFIEKSNTKKYILTITVDEEQLIKSYTASSSGEANEAGNDDTIDITQLPNTDALLAFELDSWLPASGIHVVEIEEMEE